MFLKNTKILPYLYDDEESLENTDLEGISYNVKELFQHWQNLGEPNGK